ncbi:thylakoid assembly 8-like protein, chloroplastic [Tanacetum coccineum]
MATIGGRLTSKLRLSVSSLLHREITRIPILNEYISSYSFSTKPLAYIQTMKRIEDVCNCQQQFYRYLRPQHYHDGRPRGSLWRGKKLLGKEALFVILGLKRVKDDDEKLDKFVKTHVSRLLKMDMVAVLNELERQEEVQLAVKYSPVNWTKGLAVGPVYISAVMIFWVIQKQDWYTPDVYLYKDLIIALSKSKKMDEAMQLWESMKKENLYPDSQTYTEVIRGFLRFGSPGDAMNIYEDMKQSPDPPDELPFRILLKGLLPHPLLRNKVKQDFEEIFPDQSIYDPPEEIFGLR